MHAAEVRIGLASGRAAAAVAGALAVELADGPDAVRTTCRADGATLVASVETGDLPGLRAALTSLLRLADAGGRSAALAP